MGPRVAVDLLAGSAESPVVRAVGPQYRRLPASGYRDGRTGTGSAGRQQAFLSNLDRIAAAVGSPVVPIDFELADGRRVYLDRGCVKMAERSGAIERLADGPSGVVEAVRLSPPAGTPTGGGEARSSRSAPVPGEGAEVVGRKLSKRLTVAAAYSRRALADILGIDPTGMNSGVFRRQGTDSVLLFVTERKGADRTQYADRLEGDTLFWEGQEKRATDPLVAEHRARALELLVFHRHRKDELPDYGFRYLGPFEHVSHETPEGEGPTSFVSRRIDALRDVAPRAGVELGEADPEAFDPADVQDARETVARQIKARRGQQEFRDKLLAAYGRRCAITGCPVVDVLEAAHIHPYRGEETNHVGNGLLLRADLHTLLDCGLLAIDPRGLSLVVAPSIRASSYGRLHGRTLRPREAGWPESSTEALRLRFAEFTRRHGT